MMSPSVAGGWGTSGGGYGYRPYVATNYPTSYNPLPKLLQARSDEAASIFKSKMEAGAARVESLKVTVPKAYELIDRISNSSTTIAQRDVTLRAILDSNSPGGADRAYAKAKDLLQSGRVMTDRDALAVAVAEKMPPEKLGISSGSFWKWVGVAALAYLVLR